MKDLQVKDLTHYISTASPTRFYMKDTGESFVVKIGHFDVYADFYITNIFVEDGELCLRIQSEI